MNQSIAAWPEMAVNLMKSSIKQFCHTQGFCSVMLTGGRSAERFYKAWSISPELSKACNVHFYFGDERCVPCDHPDSNYGLVVRTLFPNGEPQYVKIHPLRVDAFNVEAAADLYADSLPEVIDILLLSMGEDGHIASIFPNSSALWETKRKVIPIIGPKPPFQRLTVTPSVIKSAKQIYILAIGDKKKRKYKEALLNPSDTATLPARIVLHGTWIFEPNEVIKPCIKR
jgi:6-phosphogluconolactonase